MRLLDIKNGIELVHEEAFREGVSTTFDLAFECGAASQRLHDAQREHSIMSDPTAQKRPVAAWAMLPQAWPVEKTLAFLRTLPVETTENSADHAQRLAIIARKLDTAEWGWAYLEASVEARDAQKH